MLDHRSAQWPVAVAQPGTPPFDAQRLLLLELVVDPPDGGESVRALASALDRTQAAIDAAATALARAGLAERRRGCIVPTQAALAFEALWPVCL